MGALYGVTLIGLISIILMADASATMPLSGVEELVNAHPGAVRTLLSLPANLDSMLEQAEMLGSGETTLNQLTEKHKQPVPKHPVLFDYVPPDLQTVRPASEESMHDPLATFERESAADEATEKSTAQLESLAASTSVENQREQMMFQGMPLMQPAPSGITPSEPATANLAALGALAQDQLANPQPEMSPQPSLNDALAQFNREQTATLSIPVQHPQQESPLTSAPVLFPDSMSQPQSQPAQSNSLQLDSFSRVDSSMPAVEAPKQESSLMSTPVLFPDSLSAPRSQPAQSNSLQLDSFSRVDSSMPAVEAPKQESSLMSTPDSSDVTSLFPDSSDVTPFEDDDDNDEGDLGESDTNDDSENAGSTQSALSSQIEKEAAAAAQSVLKDTMKTVENDFLMSEKQLTKDASQNTPELTLSALRKPSAAAAQATRQRREDRKTAKREHKKMKLEAKLAFDRAIGHCHELAKEQLDHTLAGLKMQLAQQKKSIGEDAKLQEEQAKQKMLDCIRTQDMVSVSRLQATLPGKMAQVKQKAQADAQRVAVMAIQEVTSENHKLRQSLSSELGEAKEKLDQLQSKLTNSDENPTSALQEAVDVKQQKAHVAKLNNLAGVALTQEKARAASQVRKAQDDAKESVRLAMKSAQKTELGEARKQMKQQQDKIRQEAQQKFGEEKAEIKKQAMEKEAQLTARVKELVDSAINRAPLKEAALGRRAKSAYKEATTAADKYLAKKMADATPNVQDRNGETIDRQLAESAIENPSQSKEFTLENQNFAAAAKFAERQARQAQNKLIKTREETEQMMAKLSKVTAVAKAAASKAEALDEKVTRIKLAKLQLNEARAAHAFNKAATAHMQGQLARQSLEENPPKNNQEMTQFQKSMKLLQSKAKSASLNAFAMATNNAKELTNEPVATPAL